MQAMDISRTGMDVEWRRLEVIAANIANANTARTADGSPYRPLRLISGPRFRDLVGGSPDERALGGVGVYGVEPMNLPPRLVYAPGDPQADAKGYVAYPGFDQAAEMALLVKTSRIYEANAVAMSLARQMYEKALEIGK